MAARKAKKKAPVTKKPTRKKKGKARKWPATEIVTRKLSELKDADNNPRTRSSSDVDAIVASIREFGWTTPILIDERNRVIAGHGRKTAAEKLGIEEVPCMVAGGWTKAQKQAYLIADNQLVLNGTWDSELLGQAVAELHDDGAIDLDLLGFDSKFLDGILEPDTPEPATTEGADEIGGVVDQAITKLGDTWLLGDHRVCCGDATDLDTVKMLMVTRLADLVHADPPYGMGKESDGVQNDNLYRETLDTFQEDWINLAMVFSRENSSFYIWGNAPDLWRLWWCVLNETEGNELRPRNEIVWAKGSGFGMGGDSGHSYPPETERCLFMQRGPQELGNQNTADYWDGWEPLRKWLVAQKKRAGWNAKDVNEITGKQMHGHWFSKSQFRPITREHYDKLRAAAKKKAFPLTFDEFEVKFAKVFDAAEEHRLNLVAELNERRSYFDNSHDKMTDVWQFNRVAGAERFGHATPKPVDMIARAIVSSCPEGGLVFEPFLGTGSTLIAAELHGRVCYGTELEPVYVDTIVRRWQERTGKSAILEETGETFAEVAGQRFEDGSEEEEDE